MQVLPKHQMFAWRILLNKLPTRARLSQWDHSVHPCCPLCREEEETLDHLLANCSFARSVWNLLPSSVPKPTTAGSVSFWFWHQAWPENRQLGPVWHGANRMFLSSHEITPTGTCLVNVVQISNFDFAGTIGREASHGTKILETILLRFLFGTSHWTSLIPARNPLVAPSLKTQSVWYFLTLFSAPLHLSSLPLFQSPSLSPPSTQAISPSPSLPSAPSIFPKSPNPIRILTYLD